MIPPKPSQDSRVTAILKRLERATTAAGHNDHADVMDLMLAIGLDHHASKNFDDLLAGIGGLSAGPVTSQWLLGQLGDWVESEINTIDVLMFKANERKIGIWQNVFFATAGVTVLGLAGIFSLAPRAISPFAFVITGFIACLAIRNRIVVTATEVEDLKKKHGLQLLKRKLARVVA